MVGVAGGSTAAARRYRMMCPDNGCSTSAVALASLPTTWATWAQLRSSRPSRRSECSTWRVQGGCTPASPNAEWRYSPPTSHLGEQGRVVSSLALPSVYDCSGRMEHVARWLISAALLDFSTERPICTACVSVNVWVINADGAPGTGAPTTTAMKMCTSTTGVLPTCVVTIARSRHS